MSTTPEYILKKLRQRRGLEEDDTSQDVEIEDLSSRTKFAEVLGWEMGDSSWGTTLIQWAEDCGLEVNDVS